MKFDNENRHENISSLNKTSMTILKPQFILMMPLLLFSKMRKNLQVLF